MSNYIPLAISILGIGIFVGTQFNKLALYFYSKPANVESLIPEDCIRIIEISDDHNHGLSEEELCNYLEHHLDSDGPEPNFTKITFEHPVKIRFKHGNEIYSMCLKGMTSTRDDHKEIQTTPKYLSAVIRHGDDEICVTNRIREFHGHSKNFFDHIPDVISDLNVLLNDCEGQLHTYDMMGSSKVHDL